MHGSVPSQGVGIPISILVHVMFQEKPVTGLDTATWLEHGLYTPCRTKTIDY